MPFKKRGSYEVLFSSIRSSTLNKNTCAKRYTIGFLIIFLVLGIFLISGCEKPSKEEIGKYPYLLNELSVSFNGKSQGNLVAASNFKDEVGVSKPNINFRTYFENDVNEIIKNYNLIEGLDFKWYESLTIVKLDIKYKTNITNIEKNKFLHDIKNELMSKWYTKATMFDYEHSPTE